MYLGIQYTISNIDSFYWPGIDIFPRGESIVTFSVNFMDTVEISLFRWTLGNSISNVKKQSVDGGSHNIELGDILS